MSLEPVDMAWVAAVVAPWTISPHPNFSGGKVTAAQGLALVTERRDPGGSSDKTELRASWPEWGSQLVEAAQQSLVADSQRNATDLLWSLTAQSELPTGARVAAAMYASLGSLELDEAFSSVDRIGGLLGELKLTGSPDKFAPSYRLAVAVLAQQRVVRAQDAARHDDARSGINDVLLWLPKVSATGFEEFPLSRGISWSASRVQRDIASETKQNALSSKAALEQFGGDAWVRVVRARSGWIDLRHYLLESRRSAAVVRDDFELKFESTSGKRVFGRESASDVAYIALLAAEVSGNYGRARNSRAEAAKVHLLAVGDREFHTSEALRLLRQSQVTAPLKSALAWIRAEGPLNALRNDALAIITRGTRDRYASEADLLVLEGAADLLKQEELVAAIDVAFVYLETQRRNDRFNWSHLDNVWKAITRLVPGSANDGDVAARASELLLDPKLLSRPLANSLARLVSEIEWGEVPDGIRAVWMRWVEGQTGKNVETQTLVFQVRAALGLPDEELETASGLEAAAILADDGPNESGPNENERLSQARASIIAALRSEAEAAAQGTYGFGRIAPSNVAVAFAMRFHDREVWDAAIEHLLDAQILSDFKDLALDRLASNAKKIPVDVRRRLAEGWRIIASSKRDGWLGGESLPVFPEAIRLAAALGALSPTEAVESILTLASSGDTGKIQASRTLPFVIGKSDATWGHVLLLQLAADPNPNVRAEAGFSMVRLMSAKSSVGHMISDRADQLLHSDGIRCALRILHGLQSISEEHPDLVEPWLGAVHNMAASDSRRVVRGAAQELLQMVDSAR